MARWQQLTLSWQDDTLAWQPAQHGGAQHVELSADAGVWTPDVSVKNGVQVMLHPLVTPPSHAPDGAGVWT